jgi:hypothetical protein
VQVKIQYPSISYQANPYKLADIPLILEGDSSAVELNDFAGPLNPESEPERHLSFDGRIPFSLSLPNAGDRGKKKHIASRKRKFGSEIVGVRSNASLSSSYPQEMGLTSRRRIANDTSELASKRKRRRRSVSSSSTSSTDESQRNSGLVAFPKNIARSLCQSARRRRQSSPKFQETKEMARSNSDNVHISADDNENGF